MRVVILVLISVSSFAQFKEQPRFTIFYEHIGRVPFDLEKTGQLELYTDSLKAFYITWKIKDYELFDTVGDEVLKAIINVEYKEQKATLFVSGRNVIFAIRNYYDVAMVQVPHDHK